MRMNFAQLAMDNSNGKLSLNKHMKAVIRLFQQGWCIYPLRHSGDLEWRIWVICFLPLVFISFYSLNPQFWIGSCSKNIHFPSRDQRGSDGLRH
jgi:hypothetical protein